MSLQERECLGFVVWLSKFCNLLQMWLFTMYLGMEVRVGGGPFLSAWLDVECVQGCVSMRMCVIGIYVYGTDGVVAWGCYVGSVVC